MDTIKGRAPATRDHGRASVTGHTSPSGSRRRLRQSRGVMRLDGMRVHSERAGWPQPAGTRSQGSQGDKSKFRKNAGTTLEGQATWGDAHMHGQAPEPPSTADVHQLSGRDPEAPGPPGSLQRERRSRDPRRGQAKPGDGLGGTQHSPGAAPCEGRAPGEPGPGTLEDHRIHPARQLHLPARPPSHAPPQAAARRDPGGPPHTVMALQGQPVTAMCSPRKSSGMRWDLPRGGSGQ